MPGPPFDQLVNWVEHGIAPDHLNAVSDTNAPHPTLTRLICPFPQTAIYNGTGDILVNPAKANPVDAILEWTHQKPQGMLLLGHEWLEERGEVCEYRQECWARGPY